MPSDWYNRPKSDWKNRPKKPSQADRIRAQRAAYEKAMWAKQRQMAKDKKE